MMTCHAHSLRHLDPCVPLASACGYRLSRPANQPIKQAMPPIPIDSLIAYGLLALLGYFLVSSVLYILAMGRRNHLAPYDVARRAKIMRNNYLEQLHRKANETDP